MCFSSYKRYFYCHDVTGATRWDYPEGPEPDDQQQHREEDSSIETKGVVGSSTNEVQAAGVFPMGEPLPPGVDPPLPPGGSLSGANILALAGCPPPPPPPDDTTEDGEPQSDMLRVVSPGSDEPAEPVSEAVVPVDLVVVEISAPPMLNWQQQSEQTECTPPLQEVEEVVVSSPTVTLTESTSPTRATTTTSAADDAAAHQHRERRRRKDKVRLA